MGAPSGAGGHARRLIALLLASPASAALIASSQLEQCVRSGPSADELACEERKFVVALTVENGQNGTETVEATFGSAEDEAGLDHALEHPWRLVLRKSRVVLRYPITYVQSFNALPAEEVLLEPPFGCADGAEAAAPTCGWALDAGGGRITDSQGFCCDCSLLDAIGLSDEGTRAASLECSLFSTMSSAHCLAFDELWYSAYEVGAAETHFTIELGVTSYTQPDGADADAVEERQEVLELGPHAPGARTADGRIIARLIGDFARPAAALGLEHKYLLIPSAPATHERVRAGSAAWMLVDRARVTLDGSECNKIGVSHAAFRHEASRCERRAGSCLGAQPSHLHAEDMAAAAEGRTGSYLVRNFGSFFHQQDGAAAGAGAAAATAGGGGDGEGGARHYLAYAYSGLQASLLTLEMAADAVRFVTNNAPGEIDHAQVDDFEALSGEGRLTVRFTNVGGVASDFTLEVACAEGADAAIAPVAAQRRTVAPYHAETVRFPIRTDSPDAAEHSCSVVLRDALQAVTDEIAISFATTEVVEERGAQAGETSSGGEAYDGGGGGGASAGLGGARGRLDTGAICAAACASWLDVPCLVLWGCWDIIMGLVGCAVALVVALLLLRCALASPAARRGCARLCCPGRAAARAGAADDRGAPGESEPPLPASPWARHKQSAAAPKAAVRPLSPREHLQRVGARTQPTASKRSQDSALPTPGLTPTRAAADTWDEVSEVERGAPQPADALGAAPRYHLGPAAAAPGALTVRAVGVPSDSSRASQPSPWHGRASHARVESPPPPPALPGLHGAPVGQRCFLNVRSKRSTSALHSPGFRYSLRGLAYPAADLVGAGAARAGAVFAFTLGPQDTQQHWRHDAESGGCVRLDGPRELDPSSFRLLVDLEHPRPTKWLSDVPAYACLNVAAELPQAAPATRVVTAAGGATRSTPQPMASSIGRGVDVAHAGGARYAVGGNELAENAHAAGATAPAFIGRGSSGDDGAAMRIRIPSTLDAAQTLPPGAVGLPGTPPQAKRSSLTFDERSLRDVLYNDDDGAG